MDVKGSCRGIMAWRFGLLRPPIYVLLLLLTLVPAMARYSVGDVVEVMFPEPGFIGSYFLATIIYLLGDAEVYIEFHQLLTPTGSRLLRDVIRVEHIRPLAPFIARMEYGLYDLVDVFVNDGWWTGRVIDVSGVDGYYEIFFEMYNEVSYNVNYEMRPHLDWENNRWVGFLG
ncbi:protein AGENET DOMAIN (AGD)-CONTAINING P1-like [Silene latifolia]|uniref:protein AGENET DOMAIN (AGD)-CONTAINING P1-like n=1 Tax=Silene latifolia TaxID=37657 RepID=UPI003D7826DC